MKKIVFASLFLLSAAGFFFACQKETVVTATETATAAQEPVTSREESGICSYEVTIYGAAGTRLCGTQNAPGDEGTCAVCSGMYGTFTINFNTITRTMLSNVFSISNPTNVTKNISFTVTGAACSSASFTLAPHQVKVFRIAKMPTPAPGCCRVVEYECEFSNGGG